MGDLQKLLQALPAPHHVVPVHSKYTPWKKDSGGRSPETSPGTSGPAPRGSCTHSTHHGGKTAVGDLQALPAQHHVVPVHSTHHGGKDSIGAHGFIFPALWPGLYPKRMDGERGNSENVSALSAGAYTTTWLMMMVT